MREASRERSRSLEVVLFDLALDQTAMSERGLALGVISADSACTLASTS
jgi:hypothetical protein